MYILPDLAAGPSSIEIVKRQGPTNSTGPEPPRGTQSDAQTWTYVVSAIIAGILVGIAVLLSYTYIRRLKIAGRSPKYIPTKFLKRKWELWKPQSKYANVNRNSSDHDAGAGSVAMHEQNTDAAGVNRNTSVRSVMTLPPYSQKPKDTEEVIGREGERGGIDTVVELPETAEEEEGRRENEMESLYQIRQARRQEIAERDERRRERREARDRGDWARLEELRREARARRDQNSLTAPATHNASASASTVNLTAEMLIAEHNSRGRERRVSSVSYAQVGQVRHDGTRIRSNSGESERSGLLNSAAPMGSHTRNGSEATLLSLGGPPQPRYRDRSNSGATSISGSSFENITPPSEYERPVTSRTAASSNHTAGSISDVSAHNADIGNERIVVSAPDSDAIAHPPAYDGHDWGDAPEYTEAERMARANSNATMRTAQEELNRAPSTTSRTDSLSIITPSIRIETPTAPSTPIMPRRISEEVSTSTTSRTQT